MPPVPVILNPFSRRGGATEVLTALRAEGLDVVLHEAGQERPGVLAERAAQAGAPLVVVGGGDGTLAEAAAPLIRAGVTLGVLPLGTGNTFARNLGLPLDPMGAARVIARGRALRVDVGEVNGQVFLNSVTLGFSAHVAGALSSELKRHLGWAAYAVAALRALRSARPRRYQLRVDGVASAVRTRQLVAANAADVASGLSVPAADYQDGRLVLLLVPGVRPADALRSLLRWWRGDHRALAWQPFRELQLQAVNGQAMTVNVDGELLRARQLDLRARQQALSVMVDAHEAESLHS